MRLPRVVLSVVLAFAFAANAGSAAPQGARAPFAALRGAAASMAEPLRGAHAPARAAVPALPCDDVATERCPAWAASGTGAQGDEALYSMTASSGGDRVYATGFAGAHAVTVANDAATGSRLWSVSEPDIAIAYGVALSPDDRVVYVTGQFCLPNACDIGTIAYDAASGAKLWRALGSGVSRAPYAGPRDIAVTPDGSEVLVTGFAQFQGDETMPNICNTCVAYYVTLAYDSSNGHVLWARTYRGPLRSDQQNFAQTYAIAVSPDGSTAYVTGSASVSESAHPARVDDGVTIAYDTRTGAQRWLNSYSFELVNVPHDVAVSADGKRVYVGGFDRHFEKQPCSNTYCIYDSFFTTGIEAASGAQLWTSRAPGMGDATTLDVAPGIDRVFLAGYTPDAHGARFGIAVQADDGKTGARAWLWHDENQIESGLVAKVKMSPDERTVYVSCVGSPVAYGNAGAAFAGRALGFDAAAGTQTWEARYAGAPGTIQTQPFDMAVLPGDRLVLSGISLAQDTTDPTVTRQSALTFAWDARPYDLVPAP
jgi:DNA-binding beta-propeller fold protein YncE